MLFAKGNRSTAAAHGDIRSQNATSRSWFYYLNSKMVYAIEPTSSLINLDLTSKLLGSLEVFTFRIWCETKKLLLNLQLPTVLEITWTSSRKLNCPNLQQLVSTISYQTERPQSTFLQKLFLCTLVSLQFSNKLILLCAGINNVAVEAFPLLWT